MKKNEIIHPGLVILAESGNGRTYLYANGAERLEEDTTLSGDSIFDLASLSKQFTAFSILLLEDINEISLDDSVRKFVPELRGFAQNILLTDLMHHTGGLPDYEKIAYTRNVTDKDKLSPREIIADLHMIKSSRFPPGARFEYSNTGYFLLSQIVEKVSGQPFSTFLEENVFSPLGMEKTYFGSLKKSVQKEVKSYLKITEGFYYEMESPWEIPGDGSVKSTANDLLKWCRNFSSYVTGNEKIIKKLSTPGRKEKENGNIVENYQAYAGGLLVSNESGGKVVRHGGQWLGFRHHLIRGIDSGCSVIVLSNYSDQNAEHVANEMLSKVLNNEFD